jgi:hypothetical protein
MMWRFGKGNLGVLDLEALAIKACIMTYMNE